MKKTLFVLPLVAIMTACSSVPSDPYERRAYEERERNEKAMNTILDKTPDWCKQPKVSSGAVYACGEADGYKKSMTEHKAQLDAYGKICMAAGGTVDQQSKSYYGETAVGNSEQSTRAIRAICRGVDVTGVEIRQPKTIAVNGKYYSWVEVALPMGDANQLKKAKFNEQLLRDTDRRATQEFKEMSQ